MSPASAQMTSPMASWRVSLHLPAAPSTFQARPYSVLDLRLASASNSVSRCGSFPCLLSSGVLSQLVCSARSTDSLFIPATCSPISYGPPDSLCFRPAFLEPTTTHLVSQSCLCTPTMYERASKRFLVSEALPRACELASPSPQCSIKTPRRRPGHPASYPGLACVCSSLRTLVDDRRPRQLSTRRRGDSPAPVTPRSVFPSPGVRALPRPPPRRTYTVRSHSQSACTQVCAAVAAETQRGARFSKLLRIPREGALHLLHCDETCSGIYIVVIPSSPLLFPQSCCRRLR